MIIYNKAAMDNWRNLYF